MNHRISYNEYGTKISVLDCETCGREFTVCPNVEHKQQDWKHCMSPKCKSYDPQRDADMLFGDYEGIKDHSEKFDKPIDLTAVRKFKDSTLKPDDEK